MSRKNKLNLEKYHNFIEYFTDTVPITWPMQVELFAQTVNPKDLWKFRQQLETNHKVFSLSDETS